MARPRIPSARAAVEGRDRHDPQRFRNRPAPVFAEIGAPPSWMSIDQRQIWDVFISELPWLNKTHRSLLEVAVTVRTRIASGQDIGVQAMNLLRQCLGQMGATPADAGRVSFADDEEPDDILD